MMHRRSIVAGAAFGLGVVMVASLTTAVAHGTYEGCANCHGDFREGDSPQGTVFPEDDMHEMHRGSSYMNTDCNLCHDGGGFSNPLIGSSAGTAINPGVGCTGCHGRDYGGTRGNSGVGLRLHHVNSGVSCSPCHDDDPAPLPENVLPTYYGTADTNVNDPCNSAPGFLENWSVGDTEGSDNDGDLLYDGDDPDCTATCTGDVDRSGDVGFGDLLRILSLWGPCTGCPEDIDLNGDVGFNDLLMVLSAWGPC